MKHFKLNFYRFDGERIELGEAVLVVGMDDTGLTPAANRATKVFDDFTNTATKTAEANEHLAQSLSNVNSKFNDVKKQTVGSFNNKLEELRGKLQAKDVSPKTKARIENLLTTTKAKGLDNLKESQSNFLGKKNVNDIGKLSAQASGLLTTSEKDASAYNKNLQKQAISSLEKKAKLELDLQKMQKLGGSDLDVGSISKGTSAIDKLRSAMNALDKAEEGAHNKFNSFVNSLKSTAITWRIIGGFLSKIVNVFASLYENAAGYEEALNLYRVAMGEYAEKADNWAKSISEPLFLDPKDIMQYAGAFYNLTNGLGASSDAAYKMARNLTQLSYDMSSYLNIDVEAAQAKIQSAITGQARAVASAGVAMQQASLQELAYTLQLKDNTVALDDNALEVVRHSIGLKKSVKDMTQAEKTYLRYIQIMRSTTNMQGDLARTIITPANAMRVVRTQFNLFARELGTAIIPIVMKVIPYIMVLTQALQKLGRWLGKKLGYQVADINYSSLKDGVKAYTSLGDAANEAAGKTSKAADTINRSLAPFDELNVVETESSGGSGGVGAGAGGAGGSVLGDLEEYLDDYNMLEGLTDKFEKEMEKAKANIEKILPLVGTLAGAFAAIKFGKKFLDDFFTIKDFLASPAGKATTEFFSSDDATNIGIVAGLVVAIYENFKSVNDETDRFKEAWESGDIAEYFKIDSLDELMDKVRTFTFILQGGLPAALAVAGAKMGWFDGIVDKVKEGFGKAKTFIVDRLNQIKDKIVEIYEKNIAPSVENIKDLWNDTLKPVFDKLHGALSMAWELIDKVIIKSGVLSAAFRTAFEIIKGLLAPFRVIFEAAFDIIRQKIDNVINVFESITRVFKGVTEIIKGIKDGDWKKVWEGIKDVIVGAFQLMITPIKAVAKTIIRVAERMVNAVIDGVNAVIKAIKKIKIEVPDWVPKIGGNTYSLGGSINEISNVNWSDSVIDRLKTGIDFVPNDLYGPVFLDYGERVLTQEENRQYMKANDAYLSNLSNSAAIGNTKQLASEIANAIVDSMKLAEASRQPDITQVYIGNEKVYEGQGTYQSRQADRYGTSYIKI